MALPKFDEVKQREEWDQLVSKDRLDVLRQYSDYAYQDLKPFFDEQPELFDEFLGYIESEEDRIRKEAPRVDKEVLEGKLTLGQKISQIPQQLLGGFIDIGEDVARFANRITGSAQSSVRQDMIRELEDSGDVGAIQYAQKIKEYDVAQGQRTEERTQEISDIAQSTREFTGSEYDPRLGLFGVVPRAGASFAVPAGAGGVALKVIGPRAATAVAALTGSQLEGINQYNSAIDLGASEEDAVKAWALGTAVGTTEAIPISRVFNRFLNRVDNLSGGAFKKQMAKAAATGTAGAIEEGAQEYFQTVAGNLIAQKLYDEERGLFDDAFQSAQAGGILGGIINTIAGTGRRGGRNRATGQQDLDSTIEQEGLAISDEIRRQQQQQQQRERLEDGIQVEEEAVQEGRPEEEVVTEEVIAEEPVQEPVTEEEVAPTPEAEIVEEVAPEVEGRRQELEVLVSDTRDRISELSQELQDPDLDADQVEAVQSQINEANQILRTDLQELQTLVPAEPVAAVEEPTVAEEVVEAPIGEEGVEASGAPIVIGRESFNSIEQATERLRSLENERENIFNMREDAIDILEEGNLSQTALEATQANIDDMTRRLGTIDSTIADFRQSVEDIRPVTPSINKIAQKASTRVAPLTQENLREGVTIASETQDIAPGTSIDGVDTAPDFSPPQAGGLGPGAASIREFKESSFVKNIRKNKAINGDLPENLEFNIVANYIPQTRQAWVNRAIEEIKRDGVAQSYEDFIREFNEEKGFLGKTVEMFQTKAPLIAKGFIVAKQLEIKRKKALEAGETALAEEIEDKIVDIFGSLNAYGTSVGRDINAYSLLSLLSPEGQIKILEREIKTEGKKQKARNAGEDLDIENVAKSAQKKTKGSPEKFKNALIRELEKSFGKKRGQRVLKRKKGLFEKLDEAAQDTVITDQVYNEVLDEYYLGETLTKAERRLAIDAIEASMSANGVLRTVKFDEAKQVFSQKVPPQIADAVFEIYRANLFSGLATQLIGPLSTLQNVGLAYGSSLLSDVKDIFTRGELGKRAREFRRGYTSPAARTRARIGRGKAFYDLPIKGAETRYGSGNAILELNRRVKGTPWEPIVRFWTSAQWTYRIMGLADQTMKSHQMQGEAALLAYENALREGIDPSLRQDYIERESGRFTQDTFDVALANAEKEFQDLYGEPKTNKDKKLVESRALEILDEQMNPDILNPAELAGLRSTLMQEPEGALGGMARGIENILQKLAVDTRYGKFRVGGIVVPVVRITANVLQRMLDVSGLGMLAGFRKSLTLAEQQRIKNEAYLAMASYLSIIGASFLEFFKDDPEDRWIQLHGEGPGGGVKPIVYGDNWIPFSIELKLPGMDKSLFIPFKETFVAIPLSAAAGMQDAMRYDQDVNDEKGWVNHLLNVVPDGLLSVVQSTVSIGPLQGIEDLSERITLKSTESAGKKASNFFENYITNQIVPMSSLARDIVNVMDPRVTNKDVLGATMSEALPFVKGQTEILLGAFGEEVERPTFKALKRFFQFQSDDPVYNLLRSKNISVSSFQKSGGVAITPSDIKKPEKRKLESYITNSSNPDPYTMDRQTYLNYYKTARAAAKKEISKNIGRLSQASQPEIQDYVNRVIRFYENAEKRKIFYGSDAAKRSYIRENQFKIKVP